MNFLKVLAAFMMLFYLSIITGCTKVLVEYDRMSGTAFPQSETVSGSTVNLETIYAEEKIPLSVNEDDTNIAQLTGPVDPTDPNQYDYITPAELDTLQTNNRSLQIGARIYNCSFWIFSGTCTDYHLYGIVVDHLYETNGGVRYPTVMGVMWDTTNRGAFASFYKHATISGNNAKYLRSTAHEIGHAFNLHHNDGDGSTTIMNQTGTVGNTYTYTFSSNSKTHLADHPDNCRYPGTGAFGYVNTQHAGWPGHGWVTSGCN